MDNVTLVDVFKNLNYCQLAKSSLVSKKFRDLIRTHRHSLALLSVGWVNMKYIYHNAAGIRQIFGKELSPEEYNEWVIRNGYSKQIPLDDQVAESTHFCRQFYAFGAHSRCYELILPCDILNNVFDARIELSHENWPLFQHFVRLITDPFIYSCAMKLTSQKKVLSLLVGAKNEDRTHLKCDQFSCDLDADAQKFINWIKNQVVCKKVVISNYGDSNYDQELLDFFVTGAHCTPEISITYYGLSNIIVDLIQKFMDLKICDEYQFVESIVCNARDGSFEVLVEHYATFIVKIDKMNAYGCSVHVFEFVNNDVGKKLKITVTDKHSTIYTLKIDNL